jgi:hypothetical protein
MAGRLFPFACVARICEDNIRAACAVVTSSAVLGQVLRRALKTFDIGHANHPRLHVSGAPGLGVGDSSPAPEKQLTLHIAVVNVISQTRSEDGGQDKDVASIGF